MTTKADKEFDCIEFKRQAQARVYAAIKDLSPEQEIEHFRRAAAQGPLGIWWRSIRNPAATPDSRAPAEQMGHRSRTIPTRRNRERTMNLSDEQWRFMHHNIRQASVVDAFRRANVYIRDDVDNGPKEDLKKALYGLFDSYAGQYFAQAEDNQRTDDQHYKNLEDLANTLSDEFKDLLALANNHPRFRIGIAQKALNLYLKRLWCLGKIPTPPHCPFDGIILGKLKLHDPDPTPWTQMDDIEEYKRWIRAAREQADAEDLPSIAEWELRNWKPAGAAGTP
jgi:hypothetical protein